MESEHYRGSLLSVRDLEVSFASGGRRQRVVHGVDLDLAPGATLGIVGESGSGKSVSCMALARLLPSSAVIGGDIRFEGRSLSSLPERELRQVRGREIAYVFQDPLSSLNPVLTIERQVTETLAVHGTSNRKASRAAALELLRLVGISDPTRRLRQYPHELSGGMRQRVMIAAALISRPKLLIADEPTTALDVTVQAQILQLLKNLQAELGMSLILVSHDIGVVAEVADRVSVMYAGRVVESDETTRILHAPRHPYTTALLRSVPRLKGDRAAPLEAIPGSPPTDAVDAEECAFAPRCALSRPVCRVDRPPLHPVHSGGQVACFAALEDDRYVREPGEAPVMSRD